MKRLKHFLIISIIFLSSFLFISNVKAAPNGAHLIVDYENENFQEFYSTNIEPKLDLIIERCRSVTNSENVLIGYSKSPFDSTVDTFVCYNVDFTENIEAYVDDTGTAYANLKLKFPISSPYRIISASDLSNVSSLSNGSTVSAFHATIYDSLLNEFETDFILSNSLYSILFYNDKDNIIFINYDDNKLIVNDENISYGSNIPLYNSFSSIKTNFYVTHSCDSNFSDTCKVDEVDVIFQHDFSGNDYVLKVYSDDNSISNAYIFSRGNILNNVYSKRLTFTNNVSNINYQVYELVPIYDSSNNIIDYEEVLISEILNDSVSNLVTDNLSIDIVIDKYIHNDINNKPLRDIHLYYNVNLYENRYKFYYKLSCVGISNDYNCNAVKDYEFEATSNIYKFSINNEHKYNRVEAYIKDTFTGEIVSSEYLNFIQLIVPVVELEQAYGSNGKVDIKLKFNNIKEDGQYYFDLKYGSDILISKQFLNVSDNDKELYTNSLLSGQVLSISIHDVNGNQVVYYDFDIESYENIKITNNDSIFKFMTKYLNKRKDKIDKLGYSLQEAFDTIPDDIEQALLFFLIIICIMTTLMLGGL